MKVLRNAISGSRNRYTEDGYDLDLTYIDKRVLAMGYPATGMEKTYRNDVVEVASLLNKMHCNKYMIFNLSERHYDNSKFMNRVDECGFPDHHPPPLQVLLDIINRMTEWYIQDEENVVVVHCMAGKGRTGVVVTCFLIAIGYFEKEYGLSIYHQSDQALMDYVQTVNGIFWKRRGQGVRFPSQARYIYYFIKVLAELNVPPAHFHYQLPPLPPASRLFLRQITMTGVPNFDQGGCTPFVHVLAAPSEHTETNLWYNSAWDSNVFTSYPSDPAIRVVFKCECFIQGDVLIRIFHANSKQIFGRKKSQMCHVTLHTDFLRHAMLYQNQPSILVRKSDIDDADENRRFPDSFVLELHFDNDVSERPPIEKTMSVRKGQSVKRGWLIKQHLNSDFMLVKGGFVQNWKRRWFVVKEGRLTYYKSEEKLQPLGTVALEGASIEVCHTNEKLPRNGYFFKVDPSLNAQKKRIYFFGADSLSEMEDWIRVLKEHSISLAPLLLYRSMSSETTSHSSVHKMSQSFLNGIMSAPQLPRQQTSHRSSLPTLPMINGRRYEDVVDDDLRASVPSNCYDYVYSTEQLLTAKELQRHLKQTNEFSGFCALPKPDAMQYLIVFISESYPTLLDALEDDADNLIEMIAERRQF
ncbi:phosphatidylinositol-3,4,5-trisphosphate 3-phosphatase [Thraustotheca clavata]|uniref:Phosphatidylinositol-3,4,5-trisphosphate 3-phosphatase n=1 Tax=Thraustotheca clavata TaxID=74557 RepID=A0A1W0A6Z9_9STRA|nr:phosphatidylinositol-3,4,5-trisphosphate 3-phosphatase [Thraustotheca clavata]